MVRRQELRRSKLSLCSVIMAFALIILSSCVRTSGQADNATPVATSIASSGSPSPTPDIAAVDLPTPSLATLSTGQVSGATLLYQVYTTARAHGTPEFKPELIVVDAAGAVLGSIALPEAGAELSQCHNSPNVPPIALQNGTLLYCHWNSTLYWVDPRNLVARTIDYQGWIDIERDDHFNLDVGGRWVVFHPSSLVGEKVYLLNLERGSLEVIFDGDQDIVVEEQPEAGLGPFISSVDLSPDQRYVVVNVYDFLQVIPTADPSQQRTIGVTSDPTESRFIFFDDVGFSADTRYLHYWKKGSGEAHFILEDLATGVVKREFTGTSLSASFIGGTHNMLVERVGEFSVYDLETGQERTILSYAVPYALD